MQIKAFYTLEYNYLMIEISSGMRPAGSLLLTEFLQQLVQLQWAEELYSGGPGDAVGNNYNSNRGNKQTKQPTCSKLSLKNLEYFVNDYSRFYLPYIQIYLFEKKIML